MDSIDLRSLAEFWLIGPVLVGAVAGAVLGLLWGMRSRLDRRRRRDRLLPAQWIFDAIVVSATIVVGAAVGALAITAAPCLLPFIFLVRRGRG